MFYCLFGVFFGGEERGIFSGGGGVLSLSVLANLVGRGIRLQFTTDCTLQLKKHILQRATITREVTGAAAYIDEPLSEGIVGINKS